jgi:hypothetical protein
MPSSGGLRPLVNDPRILDTDSVFRVIHPRDRNGDELKSSAFQDQSLEVAQRFGLAGRCMSVVLRSVWEASRASVADLLADWDPGSGLVEIAVANLRRLKTVADAPSPQGIMRDPRPNAVWHTVVFALDGRERGKGARRALTKCAPWFYDPRAD